MKRLALVLAALLLVLSYAVPAKADCTNITIGASISVIGYYQTENTDYDTSNPDSLSGFAEFVDIYLVNTFTDNVRTFIIINLQNPIEDADKPLLTLDQAYITMNEFLNPKVTLEIGFMEWGWELRPTFGAGTMEHIYPYFVNGSFFMNSYPVGIQVAYAFTDDIKMSLGWGKIIEGSVVGNNANDFDIYFVRYDQKLNESSKFFAAIVYFNDLGDYYNYYDYATSAWQNLDAQLYNIDAGIDYFLFEEILELYLEFVWQGGDSDAVGVNIGTAALNMGIEYTFDGYDTTPYIGLDFTYIQGPDGDTVAFQPIFQDFTRTLIAENVLFGGLAGWTSTSGGIYTPGYQGIKLVGGMKSVSNDLLAVDFIIGYFMADGDLAPAGRGKGLGWEADILMSYMYTEDVTFTVGVGYFKADDDLAEAIGSANPDPVLAGIFSCTIIY